MKPKHNAKGILDFTEMMALLIGAGLSLQDALEVFITADGKSPAGRLGERLSLLIQRGSSFAGAVYVMEDVFPPIYRAMIRVGDRVGSVERIFPRLSEYLRGRKKLREKLAAALAYPLFVLALSLLGTAGLAFFIMPRLEAVFAGFGGDVAARIRANIRLMELAAICFTGLTVLPFLAAALIRGMAARKNRPDASVWRELSLALDRAVLGLPIFGGFIAAWESLNLSFALEILTGGAVPVETALREAAAVLNNGACRLALGRIRERVINGGSLSAAFRREGIFPAYMEQWLAVGERSGKPEKVFAQIRSYFQEEIDRRTGKLLLLVEPALIAGIGAVMLALVIGIVLPLFSIYSGM